MILTYDISDVVPYINWAYFYFAWQLKGEAEQQHIKREAERFLANIQGRYHTHALFLLETVHSEGDDIVLDDRGLCLPMLRQQTAGSDFLCLTDFIAPVASKMGLFATSVDAGMESDFDDDPYQKMMAQLLADRLAEATAERLHEEVRKHYWGYAKDEQLSIREMQQEHFNGFKTHLANTKIAALADMTNNFLSAIGSDIRVLFSGYTVLKSGKVKDKISITLMRNGEDCGSFDKFSEGEKARVNLANILALHELTNANAFVGGGLDLLILDEILEAVDESGLANMFAALNQLKMTCLVVSHGLTSEAYPYRLVVSKRNGVSSIV